MGEGSRRQRAKNPFCLRGARYAAALADQLLYELLSCPAAVLVVVTDSPLDQTSQNHISIAALIGNFPPTLASGTARCFFFFGPTERSSDPVRY